MKRAITITGWQRPQLFSTLVESLAANNLLGWEIFVQLEPSEFVEEYRAVTAKYLADVPVSIMVNPQRLGVRDNPYNLLCRVFGEGADLVLYLEEDLLLAPDTTALAEWYAGHHRSDLMCLSLLSGGCGSKGFISDPRYSEILFVGKNFNSLGFAVRREEWEKHLSPAWLSDLPVQTCEGRVVRGWDWSVYLHLLMTQGLYALQPAAARATHTGRYGVHCRPEFHDSAFSGLELAEGLASDRSYLVLTTESLPAPLRRQASLWDQMNSALRVINARPPHENILLREHEDLRQLSVLWAFRMFLGRDPEDDDYKNYLSIRSNEELIEKIRASAEFQAAFAQLQGPNPAKLPVDSMPNSQEAVIWAYVLLLKRKPESQTVIVNHSKRGTVGALRRAFLVGAEYTRKFATRAVSSPKMSVSSALTERG